VALIELAGFVALGLLVGALAASLGIGGGVVLIPALVVVFALDQKLAQGTSLAAIFPTAIISTFAHARARRVVWRVALPLAAVAIVGSTIGSRLALSLPSDTLRRLFGTLLILLAIRMTLRARGMFARRRRTAPSPPVDGGVDPPRP